jgi:hypothetical protein
MYRCLITFIQLTPQLQHDYSHCCQYCSYSLLYCYYSSSNISTALSSAIAYSTATTVAVVPLNTTTAAITVAAATCTYACVYMQQWQQHYRAACACSSSTTRQCIYCHQYHNYLYTQCTHTHITNSHMPGFAGEDPENLKLQELWGAVFARTAFLVKLPMVNVERVLKKAYEWVELVAKEMGWSGDILQRRKEVNRLSLHAQFHRLSVYARYRSSTSSIRVNISYSSV